MSLLLGIVLSIGALAGCSQNPASNGAADTTDRDAGWNADDYYHVPYARDGKYTVSFTKDDLVVYGNMTVDEAVQGATTEAAPEATAEAAPSEEVAAENEAAASDQAAQDVKQEAADPFASLTASDVRVSYDALVSQGDEAEVSHEVRDAVVDGLDNDGTTVTLRFTDPDAAANATSSYTIYIATVGSLQGRMGSADIDLVR